MEGSYGTLLLLCVVAHYEVLEFLHIFLIMLCGFRIMLCGFIITLCGFEVTLGGFGICYVVL